MSLLRFTVVIAVYAVMYVVCYFVAFALRFEFSVPERLMAVFAQTVLPMVGIKFIATIISQDWRRSFRFSTLPDLVCAGLAMLGASVAAWPLFTMILGPPFVPRAVILIDLVLSTLGIVLLRGGVRLVYQGFRQAGESREVRRTIIYDAGHVGLGILRALQMTAPEYRVVGFVSSSGGGRHRPLIMGIPVWSADCNLPEIAAQLRATDVLLPANLNGRVVRSVVETCRGCDLITHVVPGVEQILNGQLAFSVRDVAIADLLQRAPAELDMNAIEQYISGRRILVTGAAGSIGSELCRQILRFNPVSLVFVDHSESGVFELEQDIDKDSGDSPELHFVVADITDRNSVHRVLSMHRPEIVFHAAAYKHVPLMELYPHAAIRNNVFGTRTMVDLADEFRVERFVLISTDKAVRPANIMGATKLIAEKYLQSVAAVSNTQYITVRFGNVLNSVGSVIPTFRRQIARGGPVTVTDPAMTRYFMTIPEAVQLVLQAGAIGDSGDILILDMGEPVRIVDLARAMIALSGLRCPEDIDIEVTGVRPGEKLTEELFYEWERDLWKVHDKIFRAPRREMDRELMSEALEQLESVMQEDRDFAASTLHQIVSNIVNHDAERVQLLQSAA